MPDHSYRWHEHLWKQPQSFHLNYCTRGLGSIYNSLLHGVCGYIPMRYYISGLMQDQRIISANVYQSRNTQMTQEIECWLPAMHHYRLEFPYFLTRCDRNMLWLYNIMWLFSDVDVVLLVNWQYLSIFLIINYIAYILLKCLSTCLISCYIKICFILTLRFWDCIFV